MGTYTKFELKARVNGRFEEVEKLFTPQALRDKEEWEAQSHQFFKCEYADQILTTYRCNGSKETPVRLLDGVLHICNTIRNYGNEIQHFLHWISPYLEPEGIEIEYRPEETYRSASFVIKDGIITLDTTGIYNSRSDDNIGFGGFCSEKESLDDA